MFWVFKLSFVVDIFGFFWLGNFFGYSLKKLANFFSYHLVPLTSTEKAKLKKNIENVLMFKMSIDQINFNYKISSTCFSNSLS
jgi:predicted nuclease of restriction endonuclease-like RecB superfamily